MPQFQLQPPPFRTPLVDQQGQMEEQWRRFHLSSQSLINFILQTLATGTVKPGLMWGDEPEAPELWIPPTQTSLLPGPAGPPGAPGRDGEDAPDEQWLLGVANTLAALLKQGSVL